MHSGGDAFTSESTPVVLPLVSIFITRNQQDIKRKKQKKYKSCSDKSHDAVR